MTEPADGKRRIAFFGGSFDPPHLGHIGIARAAQRALHLDTVLFAPVGIQALKPSGSTASFEDRVAMTELAIKGLPQFAISLADAPNPTGTPNYTIDTLLRLQQQFPSAALFMLMGADSFVSLPHWRRGAEIPFVASLIVASRPGQLSGQHNPGQRLQDQVQNLVQNLAAILPAGLSIHKNGPPAAEDANMPLLVFTLHNQAGATAPFYLLPGLEIGISASEVRRQVSAALERLCAGHELLPVSVCDYIAARGLYR